MIPCDGRIIASRDINPEFFKIITSTKQTRLNKILWFLFPKYMLNKFFKNIEIKSPLE